MASLGIRGSNPIWAEFNLAGRIFDDTYYLWVLSNVIPYIPLTVYQDPDLETPWTNPIQFLGNGTLPNNVYFESGVVYRLEFRQHIGLGEPSQSDPLIYLVENYVAGDGGSTPVDTVAFASSNQITNPQFALIDFGTTAAPTYTFTGTDPDPIQIGPGWFLELSGTGTATITQVPFNDLELNTSNAPYALRLQLSGWTSGSAFLRQRFVQNGMLWANKYVSSTLTAEIGSDSVSIGPINANLFDSNGSLLANVLNVVRLNTSLNEYTGVGLLPESTNTDLPPAAYIDYELSIPSNIDIYVTSIQLIVEDMPVEQSFIQDSINRQIDQTYNTAYPIVPVGTVIEYGGFGTPAHYLLCDGTAYSRSAFNLLFQAMTKTETVTLTSTMTTFTVASSAQYRIGMPLEGNGIPSSTTISGISGTTITMSAAATISGASVVRFFAAPNGDGSTTFNVYDQRDYVVAGAGGAGIVTVTNSGIGGVTGEATHTMQSGELVGHTHSVALGLGSASVIAGPNPIVIASNGPTTTTSTGSGTPFNITQLTMFMSKCIRFE